MYEEFLREKRYLLNVSERTLSWYELALRSLPHPNPDEREVKDVVIRMREGWHQANLRTIRRHCTTSASPSNKGRRANFHMQN